jgi:hypothetical protein
MATVTTSGAVKLKAGTNVSTAITLAQYSGAIENGEAFVTANTKYDWVTNWGSLPANTKQIIADAVSSYAAIEAINFDMSGYTSRMEAQTMLDVNYNRVVDIINMIRDDKYNYFVQKGSLS